MALVENYTKRIYKEINRKMDVPENSWDSIFNCGFARGFYNGAAWRVDDIWHGALEIPENEWIIVLIKNSPDNEVFINVEPRVCKRNGYDILCEDRKKDIVAWAYVADCIPVLNIEKKEGILCLKTKLPKEECIALV